MSSRREFLQKSLLAGIGVTVLGKSVLKAGENPGSNNTVNFAEAKLDAANKYVLAPLPYAYDALEPWIDKKTMEIHHDKHHQAYVDNLNKALEADAKNAQPVAPVDKITIAAPDPESAPAEASIWDDLEARFKTISQSTMPIRNNGGGHWNHSFFWDIMRPVSKSPTPNAPNGKMLEEINNAFGSFDAFKEQFAKTAKERFGSGWAWLIVQKGQLMITSTPNQDNPIMDVAEVQGRPILGLDVWEHAYYLKYMNVRADYINGWWNLVNWDKVYDHYKNAL